MLRRGWSVLAAALLVLTVAGPAMAGAPSDEKCGEGVEALSGESISRSADGKSVTATFTVAESCNDLQVTLAIHEHSKGEGDTDKLTDSDTKTLDGGEATLTASARDCDVTAYLVTGPADEDLVKYSAPDPRLEATKFLGTGTACPENTGTVDNNTNNEETLPFTGTGSSTVLMFAGFWLLAAGGLVAWRTRYRGLRATRH